MIKLFIDKNEEVASIVGKIIASKDPEIVLVIPKEASLKGSISNFQLLKREAESAGKSLLIESVDEEILSFAQATELDAIHPLFRRDQLGIAFSDIVPAAARFDKNITRSAKKTTRKTPRSKETKKEATRLEIIPEVPAPAPRPLVPPPVPQVSRPISPAQFESRPLPPSPPPPASPTPSRDSSSFFSSLPRTSVNVPPAVTREKLLPLPSRPRRRYLTIAAAVVFLAIMGGWATTALFGKVRVVVNFKKTPWQTENGFLASVGVSAVDAETRSLPAELFTEDKNATELFPASGHRNVSQKAIGKVTIYNAYSSQSQSLVATTRFVTSDGKVFRLDSGVVVPGAKVEGGKITPSSIEAAVTADKAGPDYNIGPVERLTIPGFQGSAKYEGFYGAIVSPTTGGFVGEKAVPTDADIKTAKSKMQDVLRAALTATVLSKLPEDFKILEDTVEVNIIRITVNERTDEKGNFSVFGEGKMRAIGFRETDLRSVLGTAVSREYLNYRFRELKLEYKNAKADFAKSELRFTAAADAVIEPPFDDQGFRSQIAGQKIKEIRRMIAALPDLADAKVSFWPRWLLRAPRNTERVLVTVQ